MGTIDQSVLFNYIERRMSTNKYSMLERSLINNNDKFHVLQPYTQDISNEIIFYKEPPEIKLA